MGAPVQLSDAFGRVHDSLRISVTDRCNNRCFYCIPKYAVRFLPPHEILSFEEITRFVRVATRRGITKVRVTGGEPLVRRDLPILIEKLSAIPEIRDLALTTNGILLQQQAQPLHEAGLRRINVHLDTLDRERFIRMTHRDDLKRVLEGIQTCQRLGYHPIKLNAVAVRGLTEPDIVPLARFGRENGIEVRFIEFMPLDTQGLWLVDKVLSADEIFEILSREISTLVRIFDQDPHSPTTEYRYADGVGKVGFIKSVCGPFCPNCNRIRLTADGKLRYCLFALEETDIKRLLRSGASDEEIDRAIAATVRSKWEGHKINTPHFVAPPRAMHAIGG